MPLQFETVAIPVVKGVDVNTEARLVPPTMLLEALNSRFPGGSGASKRRGHSARVARNTTLLPAGITPPVFDPPTQVPLYYTGDRGFPTSWLFGWGYHYLDEYSGGSANEISTHPDAGLLFGATFRDQEALAWNGWQLLSRTPGQETGPLPTTAALMPMLRAEPIAKANTAQSLPQFADNGVIRVVAWIDGGDVYYSVLDSATGATIVPPTEMVDSAAIADCVQLKIVPVGGWIHILGIGSLETLQRRSIYRERPRDLTSVSLGTCVDYFDYWKVDESNWVILRNDGALGMQVTWHNQDGTVNGLHHSSSTPVFTLTGDTPIDGLGNLAIAVHPVTGDMCIAARVTVGTGEAADFAIWAEVFDDEGNSIDDTIVVANDIGVGLGGDFLGDDTGRALTIAPSYVRGDDLGKPLFDLYHDTGTGNNLFIARVSADDSEVSYSTTRKNLGLASKAFRVGNRTFVWGFFRSSLQSTWFLLDEELLPVGHLNYVTANVHQPGEFHHLACFNWSGTAPVKDTCVFHGALGYRLRVASEVPSLGNNQPAVYAEPSVQAVTIDFLPPLRAAQAGRCTYFAGAQVWSYDGSEMTEAGFHLAPEGTTASLGGVDGALTSSGKYRWRVDLCSRNAQNEEVRSHSFFTSEYTAGAGEKATLTIPTILTRRSDSYFLVYRNESEGTQWYLVSSRDPSSALFVSNDLSTDSVTFTDDGTNTPTDAELIAGEPHPANGGIGYIFPVTAPACEVIAAGQDRLWITGGEIPPGQVHPSRLFVPGETPSFNASYLSIQVDRSIEPITAIGFVGESRIYFRRTETFVDEGRGPDNSSNGGWEVPRRAYSDVGAIGPEGLALISSGLLFQSPAGIRLLAPGGGLQAVGFPVDSVAKDLDIAGTLVSGADQEVRFYARTGQTLVYNYQYDIWTTWSVNAVGVTRNPDTGLAVLAHPTGYLWDETDDLYLDAGAPFNHRIRFGWLRRGDLMDYQRVRRIGGLGTWTDPHHVHVDVYYDEREFAEEWFDWDVPDTGSQNTDTFGALNFGDGTFGDTGSE